MRGVFKTRRTTTFRDVLDGTSNTIMMGEIVVDAGIGEIVGQPLFISGNSVFLNPTAPACMNEIDPNMPDSGKHL